MPPAGRSQGGSSPTRRAPRVCHRPRAPEPGRTLTAGHRPEPRPGPSRTPARSRTPTGRTPAGHRPDPSGWDPAGPRPDLGGWKPAGTRPYAGRNTAGSRRDRGRTPDPRPAGPWRLDPGRTPAGHRPDPEPRAAGPLPDTGQTPAGPWWLDTGWTPAGPWRRDPGRSPAGRWRLVGPPPCTCSVAILAQAGPPRTSARPNRTDGPRWRLLMGSQLGSQLGSCPAAGRWLRQPAWQLQRPELGSCPAHRRLCRVGPDQELHRRRGPSLRFGWGGRPDAKPSEPHRVSTLSVCSIWFCG